MFNQFNKILPVFNCVIATTALTYQVKVMHPSQKEVLSKINKLEHSLSKEKQKK